MKKILFSDMDGTIIDLNEIIHKQDGEMLTRLKEKEHYIAFNTGRNYQEARLCVDKHGFPYDYLILNNGAHIVDKEGKEIFKKVIPQHVGRKIIEHSIQISNLYTFFYNGHRTIGYCNGETYEHAHVGNVIVHDIDFLEEYLKVDEFDIIAIHQTNEDIDITLEVQKYIAEHFNSDAVGTLNTHYLDVTAQGCSKGTGAMRLKELLDEDVETYCIGDSYNDISMFGVVDHAYTFHRVDKDISKHVHKQVDYVYEVVNDMLKEDIS
ncbi:MAG: HAD family hydrolase [Coprobacillus sp.]